ncbi:MAG: carbohydrate-binding protein [Myxococcota bacterium]|jgi:hypothetical protein|nr:carbohydrate-binding protein [Myxococcota bacterium]
MKSRKREIQKTTAWMHVKLSVMALIFGLSGCWYTYSLDKDTHTITDTSPTTDTRSESDTDTECGAIDCVDDCDPNPCVHGTCTDGLSSYSCLCTGDWTGTNCDDYSAIYEAEDCTAEQDAGVSSVNTGYMGTGYVDYGGGGAFVEWNNVTVPVAGAYKLEFRYASSVYDRPCTLSINGVDVGQIAFRGVPDSTWSDWRVDSITLPLSDGTLTIRLTSIETGPLLDRMTITTDL